MIGIRQFVVCAIAAAAAFLPIGTTAEAQIITQEPERFAFVVGQSTYSAETGNLQPLGGACGEAMQFRQRLIAMGWKRENIFPRVAPDVEETDAVVRDAICNLTTAELGDALRYFTTDISLDQAPTPSMSVIYISGHGATSRGDQYIFGVDADIDFEREVARAQQAPNYRMFSDTGVNVTSEVSELNGVPSRAVFVIIDACRDNPPLDDYLRRARQAGEEPRIDYLGQDQFSEDRNFENILILFSTRARRQAQGAGFGSTTLFSQQLLGLLNEQSYLSLSVSAIVDELPSRMEQAQRHLDRVERQRPDRFGRIRPLPVYCLWNCPQDAAYWSTRERTRVLRSAPSTDTSSSHNGIARYGALREQPAVLQLASFSDQAPETPASSPTARRTGADLRIDVFYCIDDERALERETNALEYAQRLRSELPEDLVHAGRSLGSVRLRSLDANTNSRRGYRRVDNSIWIDRDNAVEQAWAQRISRVNGERLRYWPTSSATPNYISVFFCEGAEPRRINTVFTQVSPQVNLDQVNSILSRLQQRVPRTHFQDAIVSPADTGVVNMPGQTQVRYFGGGQQTDAEEIARELQEILHEPVIPRRMGIRRGDGVRNPPIELWFSSTALEPRND